MIENYITKRCNFKDLHNIQIPGRNNLILEILKSINYTLIDTHQSQITFYNNAIHISFFSITGKLLNFKVYLGFNIFENIIIIDLENLAYFVDMDDFVNDIQYVEKEAEKNIKFYPDYILQFLKSKVTEELYYLNNELVKVVYYIEGMKEEIFKKHEQNKKWIWPWQKKKLKVVINKYEPWITE